MNTYTVELRRALEAGDADSNFLWELLGRLEAANPPGATTTPPDDSSPILRALWLLTTLLDYELAEVEAYELPAETVEEVRARIREHRELVEAARDEHERHRELIEAAREEHERLTTA